MTGSHSTPIQQLRATGPGLATAAVCMAWLAVGRLNGHRRVACGCAWVANRPLGLAQCILIPRENSCRHATCQVLRSTHGLTGRVLSSTFSDAKETCPGEAAKELCARCMHPHTCASSSSGTLTFTCSGKLTRSASSVSLQAGPNVHTCAVTTSDGPWLGRRRSVPGAEHRAPKPHAHSSLHAV